MEPVSFTVGVVALAGLFSTCVECWKYVESARSHGRDYELLATLLEVEKTRFLIWGDIIGVLRSGEDGRDEILDNPHVAPIIERILNHIIATFSDSEALVSMYGVGQVKLAGDALQAATLSTNQLSRYKNSYQQFRARVKAVQQQTSPLGKTRWAIHDRSKFGLLVEELRQLINSLKDITESPTNRLQQRQHKAIAEEIESLPDMSAVRLVKDATATVHQDWSDAASDCLEMSRLGSEDKENIISWMNNTDDRGFRDQAASETLLEAGFDVNARGFEGLHWATNCGHDHVVQYLLDQGVDVDARDSELRTPLLQATHANKTNMIELLIDRGADLIACGSEGLTPLHVAMIAKNPKTVTLLLKYSAPVNCKDHLGRTPLMLAAELGDLNIMQVLLANGARTEARTLEGVTALIKTVLASNEKAVLLLLRWGANIECTIPGEAATPLLIASGNGCTEMVRLLLEQGANVEATDTDGITSLHHAVRKGLTAMVAALLAKGANVEAKLGNKETPVLDVAWRPERVEIIRQLLQYGADSEVKDTSGETPLILAANEGQKENVEALIEGGSLIDAQNIWGETAIMMAAFNGKASIVRYLAAKGADLTLMNETGNNVLHIAADKGHLEIARDLIELGRIEVDQRGQLGNTALSRAAWRGHYEVVDLLLQSGASKEIANIWGLDPLAAAIRKGHTEVIRLLE